MPALQKDHLSIAMEIQQVVALPSNHFEFLFDSLVI
jgi:hypothetical protein